MACEQRARFAQNARNSAWRRYGAHARIRTGDLFLTKEMLYRLSYVGVRSPKDY